MPAPALRLVLTEAGIARFTAAQLGQPIDLSVARVGLTAAVVAVSPTLTALPGEFRRVATLSGKQVGRDVAHLIVRDEAALAYQVRGVGLFLADGTLFAVYAQADPIVGKSIGSTMLLALDIAFPANSTAAISFGDTNWLNPPATEDVKGVVELATDDEVTAGADASRAVTPRGLARRIAALFAARKVLAAGLASGGGALSDDVTITVTSASAAEVDAGTVATKAVTPAALANLLASLANSVRLTRRINTSGLAIGGQSLATDPTITVPAATVDMTKVGTVDSSAVTPAGLKGAGFIYVVRSQLSAQNGYRQWSDGFIEQWGYVDGAITGEPAINIVFPLPFTTECFGVEGTVRNTAQSTSGSHTVQEVSVSLNGAVVFLQSDNTTTQDAAGGFRWRATGR
ncbi:gp53-like domain-containing protein [Sphingomonas sp. Mn802worker]|uniref:gp53-like domain-containing protein n=1 Tax=Sphingomonas sp. Mn802worker TaxID=629773 RepID=UPI0003772221|nr:hypothetical protein [Sphingomonas sp. Mn802worker]